SIGVRDAAAGGGYDPHRLEQGDDLRAAGGIAEADKREGGIAADHRRRILEHFEERLVKAWHGSILTHDPGVGVAHFFDGMRGKTDHFRMPSRRSGIVAAHALAELHESMLDVARVLFVLEVFGDLPVGEAAAEPGVPPEEEGHENDEPGGDENEGASARRHFVVRGGGSPLCRGIEGNFGVGGSFWERWWSGHVVVCLRWRPGKRQQAAALQINSRRRAEAAWRAPLCSCPRCRGRVVPRKR